MEGWQDKGERDRDTDKDRDRDRRWRRACSDKKMGMEEDSKFKARNRKVESQSQFGPHLDFILPPGSNILRLDTPPSYGRQLPCMPHRLRREGVQSTSSHLRTLWTAQALAMLMDAWRVLCPLVARGREGADPRGDDAGGRLSA